MTFLFKIFFFQKLMFCFRLWRKICTLYFILFDFCLLNACFERFGISKFRYSSCFMCHILCMFCYHDEINFPFQIEAMFIASKVSNAVWSFFISGVLSSISLHWVIQRPLYSNKTHEFNPLVTLQLVHLEMKMILICTCRKKSQSQSFGTEKFEAGLSYQLHLVGCPKPWVSQESSISMSFGFNFF